ncbi:hypothetical protein [Embleya sp. NPDC020630]|uniref:hypothetical protein n=1 Tax=Embleya sp. NPDC020630 TaxID=3363979 RepID=UPI0037B73E47
MQGSDRDTLEAMVAEATIDCYNDDEQLTGLFTMLEEHLAVPFATAALGVPVVVKKVDLSVDGSIVAVCVAGRHRQTVGLLDLPPEGAEWIAAYRHGTG